MVAGLGIEGLGFLIVGELLVNLRDEGPNGTLLVLFSVSL
jgi:hypothetical protein